MCTKKCFLRLLFVLCLLLVFMSLSSFCYAVEPSYNDFDIPLEFWQALSDYVNSNSSLIQYFFDFSNHVSSLSEFYNTTVKTDLKDYFNSFNADERNILVYISAPDRATIGYYYIQFLINTNGYTNTNLTSDPLFDTYLGEKYRLESSPTPYGYLIELNPNGTFRFMKNVSPGYRRWNYYSSQIDSTISTLNNGPFFGVNSAPLNSVNFQNNHYHINGFYNINPVSSESEESSGDVIPSGDVTLSGDNGNGTFIPDYTNQLDNINSNISNSTQTIVNTISGETYKIISNQNENQKTLLSSILSFSGDSVMNDVNGIMDIEFDFANTVKDYQTRFFKGSPSGDLVFSWNGVTLFDTALIPSGDFNISAMIRENEQLGRLHHIIQVFSISSFGIILIAGYWNLFLSTIGAGSYFLMESTNETEALEDNASVDEFSYSIDEYNHKQKVAVRDSYYKELVAKTRAEMLRKAGRK